MMLGAGVALISGGFFLLAQGAKAVAESEPSAVAVLVGMEPNRRTSDRGKNGGSDIIGRCSRIFVAFGAAVVLAVAGFAVLTMSAISLANAWNLSGIAVMFGLIVAIGGLMVVAAVAPVLTAGAVGLIAFGAGCALVGAAVLLASAGLAIVASVLPIVAEYGLQASVAIGALGVAMTVLEPV